MNASEITSDHAFFGGYNRVNEADLIASIYDGIVEHHEHYSEVLVPEPITAVLVSRFGGNLVIDVPVVTVAV